MLTVHDCDDNNQFVLAQANDQDCDGSLTADDCDDSNPFLLDQSNDQDCDGVTSSLDCDDSTINLGAIANDNDCDGIVGSEDCDDFDQNSTTIYTDADCDFTPTADDCDDNDPSSTIVVDDNDCDGVLTLYDCDDQDDSLLAQADDSDCDGFPLVGSNTSSLGCYSFTLYDSIGDGWTGNAIGELMRTGTIPTRLPLILDTGGTVSHCFDTAASLPDSISQMEAIPTTSVFISMTILESRLEVLQAMTITLFILMVWCIPHHLIRSIISSVISLLIVMIMIQIFFPALHLKTHY